MTITSPSSLYMAHYLTLIERLALLNNISFVVAQLTIDAGEIDYLVIELPSDIELTLLERKIQTLQGGGIIYKAFLNPDSYNKLGTALLINPPPNLEGIMAFADTVTIGSAELIAYDEVPFTGPGNNAPGTSFPAIPNLRPLPLNSIVLIQLENKNNVPITVTLTLRWAEGDILKNS